MEDIRKNEIAVIKDSLLQKVIANGKDNKKIYILYFKEYYSRTGKTIIVNRTTYSKAFKDNNYYLIFEKNNVSNPKIYKADDMNIYKNIKNSIININLLGYYLNDNDLILMQDNTCKFLNKKDLKKDLTMDDTLINKSLFILILIFPLFILFMGIVSLNLLVIFISLCVFFISYLLLILFNSNVIQITNSINNGNFTILKDKVDEINKTLDYRSSYKLRTLTFKKYKKEIRVPKKEFVEIKRNDDVYLIINKKKEVIRCYNAKYVQFDKELEEYIK